jgi:hypothetical protein
MILERARGAESSYDPKIAELSKKIAILRTPSTLQRLRNESNAKVSPNLPSKAYTRNVLESYPSYYLWKQRFASTDDEQQLSESYNSAKSRFSTISANGSTEEIKAATEELLMEGLELVYYLLSRDAYNRAFEKTLGEIAGSIALLPGRFSSLPIHSLALQR